MLTSNTKTEARPNSFTRKAWGLFWKLDLVLWLLTCVLFVDETEYVIVERLGKIVAVYDQTSPAHSDRGLHFKLPWPFEVTRRFDRRTQLFDSPAREMFTRDRKNLTVGTYLCWRIAETSETPSSDLLERPVVKFYRTLGSVTTAEARLDSRVRSILSAEIGRRELGELLLSEDSESAPAEKVPLHDLSQKMLELSRKRENETEDLASRIGIQVVDAGIKRLNLPEGNLFSVYERMRKEREKIAQYYRSAGEAEKTVIESRARRHSEELLARAEADARRIKGEGEATALGIRNAAYEKDPDFFQILRTLEAYRKILGTKTTLILSTSSPLFKLLTEGVSTPSGRDAVHESPKPSESPKTSEGTP